MSDEKKHEPLDDVKEGLGLLFRAAKTAVESIPTEKIESAVTGGARDLGKALETVGETIEREVFGKKKSSPPPAHAAPHAPEPTAEAHAAKADHASATEAVVSPDAPDASGGPPKDAS